MKDNKLIIRINKPVSKVFTFTITPPNSTLWINSIIKEETNGRPIRAGTIYKLQDNNGEHSEFIVTNIKENKIVEWASKNKNYHCRYMFKPVDKNTTEFEYYEWVDDGEFEEPFTFEILEKLKSVLEYSK